jgi:hypothetical protein
MGLNVSKLFQISSLTAALKNRSTNNKKLANEEIHIVMVTLFIFW